MSQSNRLPQYECSFACQSRQHGDLLTATAATQRPISDAALASFIKNTCVNFLRITDQQGRTLIHILATHGRHSLLKWILKNLSAIQQGPAVINNRDQESGFTALHRSIYYGQIHMAVELIKFGCDISILDYENSTAFDIAMLDRHPNFVSFVLDQHEVHGWGNNSNFILGKGSQCEKRQPELFPVFSKEKIQMKKVSVGTFHTVFLSKCGRVWTCGNGEGGRLCNGKTDTIVLPTEILLSDPITDVAAGRDHTLMMYRPNVILSCGLNNYHQLGISPPLPYTLSPQRASLDSPDLGFVCAEKCYSAYYNPSVLYTWGLNVGQLGHSREAGKFVTTPTKVMGVGSMGDVNDAGCINAILNLALCDAAMVTRTYIGDVYLCHQFQTKKILTGLARIKLLYLSGGEIYDGDKVIDKGKVLSLLMLHKNGNLYFWQNNSSDVIRCLLQPKMDLYVMTVNFKNECIMLTTENGEAFQGKIVLRKPRIKKKDKPLDISKAIGNRTIYADNNFHELAIPEDCHVIELQRIPTVYRSVEIFSDPDANNFVILQTTPNIDISEPPQYTAPSKIKSNLKALLTEVSDTDKLHDVILKVDNQTFPAHQYIISLESDYFRKICLNHKAQYPETKKRLVIPLEIHPLILKQILLYLYTGYCDLFKVGYCSILIDKNAKYVTTGVTDENENQSGRNRKFYKKPVEEKKFYCDPIRLLKEAAKQLNIDSIKKLLSNFVWVKRYISMKDNSNVTIENALSLDRDTLNELWDANIKTSDGCIIKAHKCILAARLEYFNGMFCHSWTESQYSQITLQMDSKMLNLIIDFLYTETCPKLKECSDGDFLVNLLSVCDQLLITGLHEMCEIAVSETLTLENLSDTLILANTYNCPKLKKRCMEFASLNIATLLEMRILECVPHKILEELSDYYRKNNPKLLRRVVAPHLDLLNEDFIKEIAARYPVNLEEKISKDYFQVDKRELSKQGNIESNDFPSKVIPPTPVHAKNLTVSKKWSSGSKQQNYVQICPVAVKSTEENVKSTNSPISYASRVGSKSKASPVESRACDSSPHPNASIVPEKIDHSFNILAQQQKHRGNLNILNIKSLKATKVEDKAIKELTEFYRSYENERITVRRVIPRKCATP